MRIKSYEVEIQNRSDGEWVLNKRFKPEYVWRPTIRRFLLGILHGIGILRISYPKIEGDPALCAMIAKTNALLYALKTIGCKPRSIRIIRISRQGIKVERFVIWIDGTWRE